MSRSHQQKTFICHPTVATGFNIMKPLLSLVLLGLLITSTGCEQPKSSKEDTEIESSAEDIIFNVDKGTVEIIIIDGCEYLIYKEPRGNNQGYGFMAHKGNCKNPIHKYRTGYVVKQK